MILRTPLSNIIPNKNFANKTHLKPQSAEVLLPASSYVSETLAAVLDDAIVFKKRIRQA